MPFIWSDEYATGVVEMDNQHKSLIMIINRIELVSISSTAHPAFAEKAKDVMREVLDYTILHFTSEEVVLKMFNYPEFVPHKEKHDKFINTINVKKELVEKLLKENEYQEVTRILNEVYTFLGDWLLVHIKKNDFEYAAFLVKVKKRAGGGFFSGILG